MCWFNVSDFSHTIDDQINDLHKEISSYGNL